MKELDVLLERYLAHRYAEAPAEERHGPDGAAGAP
jgi:hypothetical protein